MKMTRSLGAIVLVVTSVLAAPAGAVPVISGFTGGTGPFAIFYGDSVGDVVGFSFTADVDLTVTDLGILDDPLDGVLDAAHMVGIWDVATQDLLGSVSVDNSGTLIDGFYYSSLGGPVNLTAGTDYLLGALYTATDDDGYLSSPTTVDTMFISNTVGVFPAALDLGFAFPTEVSANLGRLGPNMLAEPTVVPLPGAAGLLLLALGLARLVGIRRRVA